MQVVCEGCGLRIKKQQQIKHESVECENPLGKCGFCKRVFSLVEMSNHMRTCSQRVVVKMEYGCEPITDYRLVEEDMRPDDLYQPVTQ